MKDEATKMQMNEAVFGAYRGVLRLFTKTTRIMTADNLTLKIDRASIEEVKQFNWLCPNCGADNFETHHPGKVDSYDC